MTGLEKDLKDTQEGNGTGVLMKRKAELNRLWKEGKACKNGFRRQCIAQEYTRLKAEYNKIDALF